MYRDTNLVLLLLSIFGDKGTNSQNVKRNTRQTRECSLPSTGEYGICQRWSQCQTAQTAYSQNNIAPIYCQYDRVDPIVCCPALANIDDGDSNQRISEKMCTEAYTPKPTTTTPPNPVPIIPWQGAIAGVRTEPGEFTHMTALGWKKDVQDRIARNNYDFLCGGTLISDYFVLSAAHCASFNGIPPEIARIGGEHLIFGTLDANIPITDIHVHPQYRRRQVYNDIALMRLKMPSLHKPACLWQSNKINYTDIIALGYGHTTFGGTGSDYLLKVELNIYSTQECQLYYPPGYRREKGIIQSQICAGDRKKIQDTCQGDSGGPLMVKVSSTYGVIPYILGVTSFGQGCATGPPGVYVRVSTYLDWIESIIWPN